MEETDTNVEYDLSRDEDLFEDNEEEFFDFGDGKFCTCNDPDNSGNIIACNGRNCEVTWFHVSCVGVETHRSLCREWFCDNCKDFTNEAGTSGETKAPEKSAHFAESETGSVKKKQKTEATQHLKEIPEVGKTTTSDSRSRVKPKAGSSSETGASMPQKKKSRTHSPSKQKTLTQRTEPATETTTSTKKVFNLLQARKMAESLLINCMDTLLKDNLLQVETPRSAQLVTFLKYVKESTQESQSFKDLAVGLVDDLWHVAFNDEGKQSGGSDKAKLWNRFHQYRVSDNPKSKWEIFLAQHVLLQDNFLVKVQTFILQSVLDLVLKSLIEEGQKQTMPHAKVPEDIHIVDKHENQVVRYVAGYIPFTLRRRYSRMKTIEAQSFFECLGTFAVQGTGDNFLQYTLNWIEQQNRGGLFVVNDKSFLFFRSLEYHTKKTLNMKQLVVLKDINVMSELCTKLMNHSQILRQWDELTKEHLSVDLQQKLLLQVVKCWVRIRVNAFVKVYIDIRKESSQQKASQKKEKSLRKKLAANTEQKKSK